MRVAILILVLSLNRSIADDSIYAQKVTVNGHTAYIVSQARVPLVMRLIDDIMAPVKREGYWTPDINVVAEADATARKLIEKARLDLSLVFPLFVKYPKKFAPNAKENASNEIELVYKNRARYDGQYVGFITAGKRRVYCNYFYRDYALLASLGDPSTRFVAVYDGGYGFWQVQYDVDTKACLNLAINGPWELDH